MMEEIHLGTWGQSFSAPLLSDRTGMCHFCRGLWIISSSGPCYSVIIRKVDVAEKEGESERERDREIDRIYRYFIIQDSAKAVLSWVCPISFLWLLVDVFNLLSKLCYLSILL